MACALGRHLKDAPHGELLGSFIGLVCADAFSEYPTDRSCHTCDYFMEGTHCANNEHAEVPLPFRNQGCESWKDEGAPF